MPTIPPSPPPAHGTCSLVLNVNSTPYAVTPIRVDRRSTAKVWRLRKLPDGPSYTVARLDDGSTTCDCGDATFRRGGGMISTCKHIGACVSSGLI